LLLNELIKLVDNISNGFVMIQKEKKKYCEHNALFTFSQQQGEAASVKMVSSFCGCC